MMDETYSHRVHRVLVYGMLRMGCSYHYMLGKVCFEGVTDWIYLMTDGEYYRFKDKCAGIPDGNWKRWRWLKRTVEYSSKH